jgi:hypothetical protein
VDKRLAAFRVDGTVVNPHAGSDEIADLPECPS